jgi:hypothetical protein
MEKLDLSRLDIKQLEFYGDKMAIKEFRIDCSECNNYIDGSYDKVVQDTLKQQGFLGDEFLYTVFDSKKIEQIKTTGNYKIKEPDMIWANTKDNLIWDSNDPNDLKNLSYMYDEAALAVYDKSKFESTDDIIHLFKEPTKKLEALLGIGILVNID